jgi:hypothetical protein
MIYLRVFKFMAVGVRLFVECDIGNAITGKLG